MEQRNKKEIIKRAALQQFELIGDRYLYWTFRGSLQKKRVEEQLCNQNQRGIL